MCFFFENLREFPPDFMPRSIFGRGFLMPFFRKKVILWHTTAH
nr:MAG TPA: hypothetical protein [Caudoviricetes sp.]